MYTFPSPSQREIQSLNIFHFPSDLFAMGLFSLVKKASIRDTGLINISIVPAEVSFSVSTFHTKHANN